jgi:hypothetical protein
MDNTYNFGVLVVVWQTAILVSVGQAKKGREGSLPGKTANFQQADSVQGIRQITLAT